MIIWCSSYMCTNAADFMVSYTNKRGEKENYTCCTEHLSHRCGQLKDVNVMVLPDFDRE